MSVSAPALIPLSRGGTGARSASEARAALGLSAAAVLELASQAEAEAGTLNTRLMTPLRVAEAIAALAGGGIYTQVATEAELIAALAANTPLIYVTASITATQDYLVNDDCEVRLGTGVLLDMGGSYGFVVGSGLYFDLTGNGVEQSRINWNTSGVAHDLVQLDAGAQCRLEKLSIVESNTSANAGQIHTAARKLDCCKVRFTFANNNVRRFSQTFLTGARSSLQDIELVGGGSSCTGKVNINDTNSYITINGLLITGTWSNVTSYVSINIGPAANVFNRSSISDVVILTTTGAAFLAAGRVSSVYVESGASLYLSSNNASGIHVTGGTLYFGGFSLSSFIVNQLGYNGGNTHNYSNGMVQSAFATGGGGFTGFRFEGVRFNLGATITSGDNDCALLGCIFGTPSSPGAGYTLTISAGVNRTIAVGCSSDVAISDAGTGSQLSANAVF